MPNDRQHYVPQQMTRRFTNRDGNLFVLRKPDWKVDGRRKPPSSLFHADHYYCGEVLNLDESVFKRIEDAFGKMYADLADASPTKLALHDKEANAFLDWCAAQLCRTNLLDGMAAIAIEKELIERHGLSIPDTRDLRLISRHYFFSGLRSALQVSTRFTWKMREASGPIDLVISDHPVCHIRGPHGPLLIVPLSKRRLLLGGSVNALAWAERWSVQHLNLVLAGWAEERIGVAEQETLDCLIRDLSRVAGAPPGNLFHGIELPHFGMLQRMRQNYGMIPQNPPPIEQTCREWLSGAS